MSYSPVPTVVTGDTWTASQHNTYIRDNFAALHPYTSRGDIAYRNSAGDIARLALGAETLCLKSYGSDIQYKGAFGFHVYKNGYQSIGDNTLTQLTFDTEVSDGYGLVSSNIFTVPTNWDGLWLIGANGYYENRTGNDGGLRQIGLIAPDNSSICTATFTQSNDSATHVNVVAVRYFSAGATVEVKVLQKSASIMKFNYGCFWGCKLA